MKIQTFGSIFRAKPLWQIILCLNLASISSFSYADKIVLGPIKVSGLSTLNYNNCFSQDQISTLYKNSESEPHIAVNPKNPRNMIIGYHQDRFARFGGAGNNGAHYTLDGGEHWYEIVVPFTRCAGATENSAGAFDRVTDPWVVFEPENGKAHYMGLSFDQDPLTGQYGGAMVVANSHDGGINFDPLVTVDVEMGSGIGVNFLDKNAMIADPNISNKLHAVWITYTGPAASVGRTSYTYSLDNGQTWSPAQEIYNATNDFTGKEAVSTIDTQGNQIVVLPSGTLIDVFTRNATLKNGDPLSHVAVIRSTDNGKTWSKNAIIVSLVVNKQILDTVTPDLKIPIRGTEQTIVDIGVDRKTGHIYVVWTGKDTQNKLSVYISKSTDEGITWSKPKKINQAPNAEAFIPVVHVADNGIVGVLYYDTRKEVDANDNKFLVDAYLLTLKPNLDVRTETRLSPDNKSMDLRQAVLLPVTGSSLIVPGGYFIGDYFGLDSAGNDFVAAYTVVNTLGLTPIMPDLVNFHIDTHNRQDIYFAKVNTSGK